MAPLSITRTERLLRELIALPSVNPAFLPAGHRFAGERRVADFLAAQARKLGFDFQYQSVLPGRSNLIVRLLPAGAPPKHRVLLAPHLDTVGAELLPGRHFSPTRRSSRLHGRGACDTKGSVAAMFDALCDLARSGRRPLQTEVVFIGLADEENAQMGSRALVRSRFKADFAIVGEPTCLRVVSAHKGDLWLDLETRGKAAHGARPELGRNAVHLMARVVDALQTDYAAHIRRQSHPLLGFPTVNVGLIEGGRQPNIVPDRCRIRIDRRTLPGESDAAVKRHLVSFLGGRGLRVRMQDIKGVPSRPLDTDPRNPWVRRLMRIVGQRQPRGVDFFSDAGVLGASGIPAVLFGPGDIAQAHTNDEWISLRQLEESKNALLLFLRELP